MQRLASAGLFSLALALSLAAPAAQAQTAPAACSGVLTNDCLGTLLTNMGYTPKALSKGYLIVVQHGTWTLNVQLLISPGGHKLGMNANLGTFNDTGVTADNLKAILVKNGDIDPSTFYWDAGLNRLYLHRVMDNREVSAGVLHTELEAFTNDIETTSPVWTNITH